MAGPIWPHRVMEAEFQSKNIEIKIIVFNQTQLHRVVSQFVTYYHEDRGHLGLDIDAPEPRVVSGRSLRPVLAW